MVKLNSVGSILDTKTGMVYPQNTDGTPDLNCGGYLEDSCGEWFDSLSSEDRKIVNGVKGIDLEEIMNSSSLCVNGKPRKEKVAISLKMYNRRIEDARYYFYKYSESPTPIMADHKRAMEHLNSAYCNMKEILHQIMLDDAPTREDRDKPEWNDLYWVMPHYIHQFGDKAMDMLSKSKYNSFCDVFSMLKATKASWKEAK